jgi:hypothetical protein
VGRYVEIKEVGAKFVLIAQCAEVREEMPSRREADERCAMPMEMEVETRIRALPR